MFKKVMAEKNYKILLVDDEEEVLRTSRLALKTSHIKDVNICSDSRKVMDILGKEDVDIMVMDIVMPHISGKELLSQIKEKYPHIIIIMMSGLNDIDNVVECMRIGAVDYLDKPVSNLRLTTCVKKAIEYKELRSENEALRGVVLEEKLNKPEVFSKILTKSQKMTKIFKYLEAISESSRAVLITGDTGTGKELIAEAVHNLSGRKGRYVTINVAGLDDTLFSDALFGHKKGAYTGAGHNREGLLEQAEGGSLFLDEIGDLSMSSQVKLLRILQEKEYYQLGDDVKRTTNTRFIVATSQNIFEKVKEGSFRKDLYYRLHAHQVQIPSLRERLNDIPLLAEFFAKKAAEEMNVDLPEMNTEIMQTLCKYSFPGNIRELEAMIFNAVSQTINGTEIATAIKSDMSLSLENFDEIHEHSLDLYEFIENQEILPTIDEMANKLIEISLKKNNNNQTYAAKSLGISRQGLLNRMKKIKAK
jgi:DNA-binding NtrC family response regulator